MKSLTWLSLLVFTNFVGHMVHADTLKIGVGAPHTGASAAFGEQIWHGAKQATNISHFM